MSTRNSSPLGNLCTIQDRVANHLRQLILDGALRPGDRMNPAQLAQELGTSTMPVREALHQLEAEEFLVSEPYRGTFVAHLSPDRIEELYVMRVALEEFATSLGVPLLTPDHLAAMERQLAEMQRARRENDPGQFYDADRTFHEVVIAAAGRPTLLKQVRDLRTRCLRCSRLYQGLPGVMAQALVENEQILEACRIGDRQGAVERTRAHVMAAARQVVSLLRSTDQP